MLNTKASMSNKHNATDQTLHTNSSFFLEVADIQEDIQSTLVISKSKGPSKTLRDIRTSTYQICGIEEKTI